MCIIVRKIALHDEYASFCSAKEALKEHLERFDTSAAKTVLAILGVAVVILLLWLDYRGY